MSFYYKIINFFNQNPTLDTTDQKKFWNEYLQWCVQASFNKTKKRWIKREINNLYQLLNLKNKWNKHQSQTEILNIILSATETSLISYLIYSYFNLQCNKNTSFAKIYQTLLDLEPGEQIDLLYYCFEKIVSLIINYFNEWTEMTIDFILSYCFAIKALTNNQTITMIKNSDLIHFVVGLHNLNALATNHYLDSETKKDILVQVINFLPLIGKRKHFFKLLKKYFKKK